jgi:hypothetical protein
MITSIAGFTLAACGSAAVDETSNASTPPAVGTDRAERGDRSDVPKEALAPIGAEECIPDLESWVRSGPVFVGTPVSIDPIQEIVYDEASDSESLVSLLSFRDLRSLTPGLELPSTAKLRVTNAYKVGGNWSPATGYDSNRLLKLDPALVWYTPARSDNERTKLEAVDAFAFFGGAAGELDGNVSFAGVCDQVYSTHLAALVDFAGAGQSPFEFLVDCMTSPEQADRCVAIEQEFLNPPVVEPFDVLPVDGRSLRPIDVPADVAARLDVRAVFLDFAELPSEFHSVGVRTESAVSMFAVPAALPVTVPVYFLPEDKVVEIGLRSPESEWTTVLTIPVEDLRAGGGAAIPCVTADATATVLSQADTAKRFGVPEEQLESMRLSFLSR